MLYIVSFVSLIRLKPCKGLIEISSLTTHLIYYYSITILVISLVSFKHSLLDEHIQVGLKTIKQINKSTYNIK